MLIAQAKLFYKSGCGLLLMILITPSDVSPGVHSHRDLPSCHKSRLDKMVSADGPQWRGTHDHQWLVKRLNPVPVVIGDFDGLFCDSALLDLKSLPHPLSWVLGRSVLASSSPFPGPWVFRRWLEFLLVFGVFPSPLIRPPFLILHT